MNGFRAVLGTLTILLLAAAFASAQTSSLSGHVIDSQGSAIANAEVSLERLPSPGAPMPNMPGMKMDTAATLPKTQSSDDGAFVLQGALPPGQYVLEVDAPGFERWSQEITIPSQDPLNITVHKIELPQAEGPAPRPAKAAAGVDTQVLLDRIAELEKRVIQLESTTVLSEPNTRTKRVEVWVDKNSNEYDHPVAGAKKVGRYQPVYGRHRADHDRVRQQGRGSSRAAQRLPRLARISHKG